MATKQAVLATAAATAPATALAAANATKAAAGTINTTGPNAPSPFGNPATTTSTGLTEIPTPSGFDGVGGTGVFRLILLDSAGNPTSETVEFEMPPARRYFGEKTGQQPPGVGAGLPVEMPMQLAKLKVPGSRSVKQTMGIGDQTVEFVGAFIGQDEYPVASDGFPTYENDQIQGSARKLNAYERLQILERVIASQVEVQVQLGWSTRDGKNLDIVFSGNTPYKGIIGPASFAFATAQRSYFRFILNLTNREDVEEGLLASGGRPFNLPSALSSFPSAQPRNAASATAARASSSTGSILVLASAADPAPVTGQGSGLAYSVDPVQARDALLAGMPKATRDGMDPQARINLYTTVEAITKLPTSPERIVDAKGKLQPGAPSLAQARALSSSMAATYQTMDSSNGQSLEVARNLMAKTEGYVDVVTAATPKNGSSNPPAKSLQPPRSIPQGVSGTRSSEKATP